MGVTSMLRVCSSCQVLCRMKLLRTSAPARNVTSLAHIKARLENIDPLPRKEKVEPLVKNFFVGKVDTNLLQYPELDSGRLKILEEVAAEVEASMKHVDSVDSKIPEEVILGLKNLGLFGLSIPKEYGGLNMEMTEILRLFEAIGSNSSIFHSLNAHYLNVVTTISAFGSEEQKKEILPQLASGDLICGFALWEKNAGTDLSNIETGAVQFEDVFEISGTKLWVSNARLADKFIVFAKTKEVNVQERNLDSITCFLVDKNSPGISAKPMETAGVQGFELWELTFSRTKVSKENMIGNLGEGLAIAMHSLNANFTLLPSLSSSILKALLSATIKHVINRKVSLMPLAKNSLVKQSLAQVAQKIYAIESMAYFTAGLIDDFEEADTTVEAAIMKAYCVESLKWGVEKCCSVLGSKTYLEKSPYQQLLRDVEFCQVSEGSPDVLKLFIAMMGLCHAGQFKNERVMQKRNPLLYPKEVMRGILGDMKNIVFNNPDALRENNIVGECLHPNMRKPAAYFDMCLRRLDHVTESLLGRWGSEVLDKQMDLVRLADIAIECYVTAAVISRASRSASLKLSSSEDECVLALTLAYDAQERVERLVETLANSPYVNNDSNFVCIADNMVGMGGYKMAHPLTRAY